MPLCSTEEAIAEIRQGKMIILVDDEDRENEGDLTMAAEFVTPEAINFMAKFGRGLICLPMSGEMADKLQLPLMAKHNGSRFGTNFTVSIEAREGITTGISAADRATTIKTAVADGARPDDLVTPGHVFPLRARPDGVLARAGQTEGSVDLARLAGGSGRSLEVAIPSLWPEGAVPPAWALLQRLDARTSGIVCAAVADDADSLDATVRDFRQAEAEGRCCKGYLALLSGCLEQEACVRRALDMAQRRVVRVLDAETADATRWTWFRPLYRWQGESCRAFARELCRRFSLSVPSLPDSLTLAGCTIHRGARHQIRAHAAALGHALWLDGLYASSLPQSSEDGQGYFFLHHGALHLPEARWLLPPDWLPEGEIAAAGRKWLENDFMDTV